MNGSRAILALGFGIGAMLAANAAQALKIHKPTHGRTHIGTVYQGGIFNDGGGTTITPTRSGGIVVKKIPPWQPKYGAASAAQQR